MMKGSDRTVVMAAECLHLKVKIRPICNVGENAIGEPFLGEKFGFHDTYISVSSTMTTLKTFGWMLNKVDNGVLKTTILILITLFGARSSSIISQLMLLYRMVMNMLLKYVIKQLRFLSPFQSGVRGRK